MNIVCAGDCVIDRYVDLGVERCGGISFNVAVHARRAFPADDRIQLVSAVGNDDLGRRMLECVANSGVDACVRTLTGETALQPIKLTSDGDRTFLDYRAGVLESLELDAAARRVIGAADVLATPLYAQIAGLFDRIMRCPTRARRVVDFADIADDPRMERVVPYVDQLDIAFFGIAAGDTSTIDALKALAAAHDKLFVITLGAAGSLAVGRGSLATCSAIPVAEIVDTTGAGDSFAAGFLAAYCHGADLGESLAAGARRAAGVLTRIGTY